MYTSVSRLYIIIRLVLKIRHKLQYEIEQYVNHTFKPEFDRNFKIGDKVYISIKLV